MRAVDIIRKKRDGRELTQAEIAWFVEANLRGEAADYQLGALLMAIFLRDLNPREVGFLTRAFMESGEILDLSDVAAPKVDKHSTGGVGDKVSLILAPLVACAGLGVPMVSGRGLGHTGGTLDKLESIPGFNPFPTPADFRRIVDEVGCCIIGQTDAICPADRKWYALRDVTGTVESVALITASIMSKKLAEGIDALLLDVKFGSGAFMPTPAAAETLAASLVRVGAEMGKPVRALLTDMNQPLGVEIGNANEVAESVAVLAGKGDARLTELCLILGGHMLVLGGLAADADEAARSLRAYLDDGRALAKFAEMVAAQGGDVAVIEDPTRLPKARETRAIRAAGDGFLAAIDTGELGRAAVDLGAGRARAEDAIDFGAGITMFRQVGDRVRTGDALGEMRAAQPRRLDAAAARLEGVFRIAPEAPPTAPLVTKVLGT